ncbi:MAG: type II toxin-antitoxin system PemK/MazF family toxin [Prolixibacteraceae bacterium]|nr:type II toxin-antitoxin system PemK/MazF family toxin [Prolixibacteraceae bacterium]
MHPNPTNHLKSASEILTFHIRSLSKDRLVKKIGTITDQELTLIKQGLDDILRY